jgi:hypothetical protein
MPQLSLQQTSPPPQIASPQRVPSQPHPDASKNGEPCSQENSVTLHTAGSRETYHLESAGRAAPPSWPEPPPAWPPPHPIRASAAQPIANTPAVRSFNIIPPPRGLRALGLIKLHRRSRQPSAALQHCWNVSLYR